MQVTINDFDLALYDTEVKHALTKETFFLLTAGDILFVYCVAVCSYVGYVVTGKSTKRIKHAYRYGGWPGTETYIYEDSFKLNEDFQIVSDGRFLTSDPTKQSFFLKRTNRSL